MPSSFCAEQVDSCLDLGIDARVSAFGYLQDCSIASTTPAGLLAFSQHSRRQHLHTSKPQHSATHAACTCPALLQVWNSDTSEEAKKGIQSDLVSDAPEMRLLYTTPGEPDKPPLLLWPAVVPAAALPDSQP
jgi:hypothetical protein